MVPGAKNWGDRPFVPSWMLKGLWRGNLHSVLFTAASRPRAVPWTGWSLLPLHLAPLTQGSPLVTLDMKSWSTKNPTAWAYFSLADSHGLARLLNWGRPDGKTPRSLVVVSSVAGRGPGPSSDSPGTFYHVRREARVASSFAIGSAVCFGAAHHTSSILPGPGQAIPSNGLQRSGLEQCRKLYVPTKSIFVKALCFINRVIPALCFLVKPEEASQSKPQVLPPGLLASWPPSWEASCAKGP